VTLEGGPNLERFRFWWCKAVTGFAPRRRDGRPQHCAECLRGPFLKPGGQYAPAMNVATPYVVPAGAVCLYFCGVSDWRRGGSWPNNFHAPLVPAPGQRVELPMFAGQTFRARDATLLPIPPLPDGFAGLPLACTRCRNYRFGVAQFGAG
jgi:hypothetical protein